MNESIDKKIKQIELKIGDITEQLELDLDDRHTPIIAMSLDQGHYGIANCGHCRYTLPEPHRKNIGKKCPGCDYKLVNVKAVPYPYGGTNL